VQVVGATVGSTVGTGASVGAALGVGVGAAHPAKITSIENNRATTMILRLIDFIGNDPSVFFII
jgi:hypothetical protein